MEQAASHGPLTGLRVLEIGHFVAAPFCTRLLGDLGADIIKIEPPSGDPVRQWGKQLDGNALWWSSHARNKRCITLNLKHPKAAGIVLRLVEGCDALVENFRPGQLAKLGLGTEVLRRARPGLVIAHISGFGQDGPYRDRAAFGVIGEAIGGLRHLTNHPPGTTDLPPVRVGISIGDSLAGLYAAFGIMAALWQRDRAGGDGRGRTLDVALTEAVLSMMEGMLPEYGALGLGAPADRIEDPDRGTLQRLPDLRRQVDSDRRQLRPAVRQAGGPDGAAGPRPRPALYRQPGAAAERRRARPHHRGLDQQLDRRRGGPALSEADIPCTQVYTAAEMRGRPAVPASRHGARGRGPAVRPRSSTPASCPTCPTIPARCAGRARRSARTRTRSCASCSACRRRRSRRSGRRVI